MTYRSQSEKETEAAGQAVAHSLREGDVVLLSGEMGAGKTVFARGLAHGLGADAGQVSSPSFSLMNVYEGGRLTLLHLDLYRLDAADLYELGFYDMLPGAAAVIEWPERLSEPVDAPVLRVRLSGEGHEREIAVTEAS